MKDAFRNILTFLLIAGMIMTPGLPFYSQQADSSALPESPFRHFDEAYYARIEKALGVTGSSRSALQPEDITPGRIPEDFLPDSANSSKDEEPGYIAVFRDSAEESELADILKDVEFQVLGPSRARTFWIRTEDPEGFFSENEALIASFEQDRKVSLTKLDPEEIIDLWVDRNRIRKVFPTAYTVNDPLASTQWAIQDMNLPSGWMISRGSLAVTVAVIDTGLHVTHEDFEGTRILDGWDFVTEDVVRNDLLGHGTRVTGIIAATMNNSKGIAGICEQTSVLPIQVFQSDSYAYEKELLQGIFFAVDSGADVINMSLGSSEYSAAEHQAVNYALARGCIVVAASGNSGNSNFNYPAALDGVVSVSAYNSSNQIASFSTYNSKVIISAPGVNIPVMTKAGSYTTSSGTSFAAPHISGIAALAVALSPALTAGEFISLLRTTSIDLGTAGRDNYYGYGKVDAAALLEALPGINAGPPPVNVSTAVIPQLIHLTDMEKLTVSGETFYYGEYIFTPEITGVYSFAAQSPGDSDIYFIDMETEQIIDYDDSLNPFWCDILLEGGVSYILSIINYGTGSTLYTSTSFTISTPVPIQSAGVVLSSDQRFNHWSQVLVPANVQTGTHVVLVNPVNSTDLYTIYKINNSYQVIDIEKGVHSGRKYFTYSNAGDDQLRLDILSSVTDVNFRVIHDAVRQISQNIPYTATLAAGDYLTSSSFNPPSNGRYHFQTNRSDATVEVVFQATGVRKYFESPSFTMDLQSGKAINIYIHTNGSALTQTFSIRRLSSDASLAGLNYSKGTMSPAFNKDIFQYDLNIDESTGPVTISAQSSSPAATVTMDGDAVLSIEVDVPAGESKDVVIAVTSEDLSDYRLYTIRISRSSDECELLGFDGAFDEYSVHAETSAVRIVLPFDTEILSFLVSDLARWEIFSDETLTQSVDALNPGLVDGLNEYYLKVTAENGRDFKVYPLLVYRPGNGVNPPAAITARDSQGRTLKSGEMTRFDVYVFAFGLEPFRLECQIDGTAQPIQLDDPLTQEGVYSITLTDANDQTATADFVIDKTPPDVTGVQDVTTYFTPVRAFFDEGSALLDGQPYISGTIVDTEGDYVLVVTDVLGNAVTISFSVKKRVVTVNGNNGTAAVEYRIFDGQAFTQPADPVRAHYDFSGWYQDSGLTVAWDFDTLISSDIQLYAKWTIHRHTVVFNSRGGSAVPQITLDYGALIPRPDAPSREGYVFSGWYRDLSGTLVWNFSTDRIEGDLTLYAKWVSAVPDTVTSSVYAINQAGLLISKVEAGTTRQVFISRLAEGQYIRIFKAATEITSNGDILGTGVIARLMDGSVVKASYTLVITGDINGDGRITLTDYVQLKTHLVGGTKLTGPYEKAGDVNGDSKITLTDFVQMKLHLLKKQNITPQAH